MEIIDDDKLGDSFFIAHTGGELEGNKIKVNGRVSLEYDGKTYQCCEDLELWCVLATDSAMEGKL